MQSSFSAILFDLDGTLTDPAEGITNSIAYALQKLGMVVPERRTLTRHIGPPLHQTFIQEYGCDDATATTAVAYYREYFGEIGIFENRVYEGIPPLLMQLGVMGIPLFVATSKPTIYAERIVAHFGLTAAFTGITGSHLDGRRTDKAEVIAAALAGLPQTKRERVLMVGDREHDLIGARTNGIASAAVTYGYGALAELVAAQPTFLLHSVDELAAFLTAVAR